MSRSTPSLDDLLDAALATTLAQGWNDEVADAAAQVEIPAPKPAPKKAEREYPPLPVREPPSGMLVETLEPQPHGGALKRVEVAPRDDEDAVGGLLDIGLLTDLASGRKGAAEAALAAGVTPEQIQSALATALHDIDPKEIAKALGLQAAEQQLKSGALYGAVLHDLVLDMSTGRMKSETKIELLKLLAKVGRIEPKEDKIAGAGGGFTLNINLGAGGPQPITIEAN